jgi:hypothetical protein
MTIAAQLQGLARISAVARDHRLAALHRAQVARQMIVDRIAALDLAPVPVDLPLAAAHMARLNYQAWADQRRIQLNLQLAQASAAVLQAEAEARQVFAKDSVLTGLSARMGQRRRE